MGRVKIGESAQMEPAASPPGATDPATAGRSRLAQWVGTIILYLILSIPLRLALTGQGLAVELAILVLCAPAAWMLVSRFGHRQYAAK